jgi:hypothetical protein
MGSNMLLSFRTFPESTAERPCLWSAGEAKVLAVVAGLYHSAFPFEPAILTAGSRFRPLTGLITVNNPDRKREGVVGVFVRWAIVGLDDVAMIWVDTRPESWTWWGFEFTAVGWVAVSAFIALST